MDYNFLKNQMEQQEKKLLKNVEDIRAMQLKLMSPTYALLNGSELDSARDSITNLQSKLITINSSSLEAYRDFSLIQNTFCND